MNRSDLPTVIVHDGARLLYFSTIDSRHRRTENATHWVNGKLLGSATALVIYEVGSGRDHCYYLLGYNPAWDGLDWTLTRHNSLEEAKRQAEFEYEGIRHTWEALD